MGGTQTPTTAELSDGSAGSDRSAAGHKARPLRRPGARSHLRPGVGRAKARGGFNASDYKLTRHAVHRMQGQCCTPAVSGGSLGDPGVRQRLRSGAGRARASGSSRNASDYKLIGLQ